MVEYALKDCYANYLRSVRNLRESSINHYVGGLKTVSSYLKSKGIIKDSIYEIGQIEILEKAHSILMSDDDFAALNTRGNSMYSAALNNYIRFAKGDDFFNFDFSLEKIDMPLNVPALTETGTLQYSRSSIIKIQSIKASKFVCEIDNSHKTFIAKSNMEQYMEGHHLIPLSKQREFDFSLDNYANIVCLCPICHRLLHYGIEAEKKNYLKELYKSRFRRLRNIGIELNCNQFLELTM